MFEKLYNRLPRIGQNAALSLLGMAIKQRRYGGDFATILSEYAKRSGWTQAEVAKYRDRHLASFLQRTIKTSPYYAQLFEDQKIDPRDIRRLEDMACLPLLTKDDVRMHFAEILPRNLDSLKTTTLQTSGTTGAGLKFPWTIRAEREKYATTCRYRLWHGLTRNTWCHMFTGRTVVSTDRCRPPYWRVNYAERQVRYSGYHLTWETAPAYLGELRRRDAQWLYGYPSSIATLARYAIDTGTTIAVRWVTLASENVFPQQEDLIRQAFGVCPIHHYAMAENVANISMCPQRKLHVDEDNSAVEFVPVSDNICKIVGTNYTNDAFPLLRYDTGDLAAIKGTACDCGRPGRIVDSIDGRAEDYVITKSGVMLGRLDHWFKDQTNIVEAQIQQHVEGRIDILVVKAPAFSSSDENSLTNGIEGRVKGDLEFSIKYVESIPRTTSGKLRFVVTTLAAGKISPRDIGNKKRQKESK